MARLTKFDVDSISLYSYVEEPSISRDIKAIKKLGQLEDLEERIGCPLDILIRLQHQHLYYAEKGLYMFEYIDFWKYEIVRKKYIDEDDLTGYYEYIPLENYGKTWWLDEEDYRISKGKHI